MKKIIFSLALGTLLLACCTSKNTSNSVEKSVDTTQVETVKDTIKDIHLLGGDRDEHGCIPSAGYIWCEKLQKCIRPWEEKCE